MACIRSAVRPSCRKNSRWPSPQSGAERNWSGPAPPWETPSASPEPIWCNSKSENRFACTLLSAATYDVPVVKLGVWHTEHFATLIKRFLPFWTDWEQVVPVQDGVG